LLDNEDVNTLAVVQDWVGQPHDASRQGAVTEAATMRRQTPAGWIALAAQRYIKGVAGEWINGSRLRPLPAAHAVNAGILAGLARVALADRFSVLSAFVEMGIQLAETEALRRA
jgi:uncharacterized protein DUF6931